MAGMQQIETPVGEHDAAPVALVARRHLNQFILRNNFSHGRRSVQITRSGSLPINSNS